MSLPRHASVVPTLRYRDAPAAIDWLCRAFGFERRLVVAGEDGTITHAELTFRNGMIMLGSAREDAFGAWVRPPEALGGLGTQSAYVVVQDVVAHQARAVAAGAVVVRPLEAGNHDFGYACRDPEGHVWSFGAYDPWEPPTG